jgi:hypothetical protein
MRAIVLLASGLIVGIMVAAGQDSAPQTTKKMYVRTGNEGTISGFVRFKGKAPGILRIDMTQDAVCTEINPNATVENAIITKGKLANVFIYVKDNDVLENYSFETPSSKAVLQHKGCRYLPHVLGIQTQQTLRVVNSDPTTHNTHPFPKVKSGNPEWNKSQPPGSEPIERRFDNPDLFIPFKDNQHPWEKAWVGVFAHPFFAVSGKDGSYKIEGLPPGDYTVVAWHEKFGEQTIKVTVVPYEMKFLNFSFEDSK